MTERGIIYAPDFIANAGGLISVYGELHSLGGDRLNSLVDGIGEALRRVFGSAERRGVTPLEAARALAEERLNAARFSQTSSPSGTSLSAFRAAARPASRA